MNVLNLQDIKLIHRNLLHSYTKTDEDLKKVKETITFITATKRIKQVGINPPKETKDQYTGNYKTLMKEIKDETNRMRDILCFWTGTINIVKMTILFKTMQRFNAIPINLSMVFFIDLEQKISQFVWKQKRP